MIKSWLITTSAPVCGTEQYYCAFSKENPEDLNEIQNWFWNEETVNLWDSYSYLYNSDYEEQWEEAKDDYEGDYEGFMENMQDEWRNDCNIDISEMSEEELKDYGYNGNLPEIIYDERKS